jgi:hypothetical protein
VSAVGVSKTGLISETAEIMQLETPFCRSLYAPNASGEILIQLAGSSNVSGPSMLGSVANAARITCLQPSAAGVPQEVNCPSAVPEPGTIALLALSFAGIFVLRRQGIRAA